MTSYLNNGYDVRNYFAKFEKFLPHSITIPSFMTIGRQMPEYTGGPFCPPPYKIGSQNTPYNLELKVWNLQGTKNYLSSNIGHFTESGQVHPQATLFPKDPF